MTEIEAIKENIKLSEKSLVYQSGEKKENTIREIDEQKTLLLEKYKDTTYASAMTFNEYEAWIRTQGVQKKHKTGISFIDNIFDGEGIQEESFINLVGASGTGKSTLGLKILANVAEYSPCYFVSLEMGKFKTYNKIASMLKTPQQRENLSVEIWTDDFMKVLRDIELYAYNGCKFFLIDSKMKLTLKGNEATHEKISKMSNMLSRLTQKHGIIIILINQISDENLRNGIINLKGSGDQQYDSDMIISIEKHKKDDNKRIFHIYKNRQNDIVKKIEYGLDFKEVIEVEESIYQEEGEMPYV